MLGFHRYEHKDQPLAPIPVFLRRIGRNALVVLVVLAVSLAAGTAGYHFLGRLGWLDAFLNAAMILTGMGPVDRMETAGGKLFSAFYALFSGVTFLTLVGFLVVPIYHRLLHRFHLQTEADTAHRQRVHPPAGGPDGRVGLRDDFCGS
jgi:hypothetical protein